MNIGAAETAELNLIGDECESAFIDLLNDPSNNGRLMDFVDKYHLNSLNAPNFCSELYDDVPKRVPEAAIAAAVAFLIPAFARWGHSVLRKRKTTVKKSRKITALLIMGAGLRIKHHARICELEMAAGTDEEEVPAVKASVEELLAKVEVYCGEMKWINEEVKRSIINHLG